MGLIGVFLIILIMNAECELVRNVSMQIIRAIRVIWCQKKHRI